MEIEASNTEGWQLLASNDEWVLLQVSESDEESNSGNCMLMWLPAEIPPNFLRACQKLASTKNLVPGMDLQFVEEPSAGFLIFPRRGWSLKKGPEAQHTFEKMIWELDRLRRA